MGKLRISILSSILLFSLSQLSAKDDTAAKLEAIEKRLASLEQENALLTKRILQLENSGTQAIAKQLPALIPKDETEKKAFFDTFRREFKSSQDQARGPWTNPEPWTKIRKRMSEYSVREILGRPSRMRPSVKPSVEVVYSYTGDLDSDGEDETGDHEILQKYGLESSQGGAGAADPKAIDFQWHQRNFENALNALSKDEKPEVDGKEGRRAVELICAIYDSIKQDGKKITLK